MCHTGLLYRLIHIHKSIGWNEFGKRLSVDQHPQCHLIIRRPTQWPPTHHHQSLLYILLFLSNRQPPRTTASFSPLWSVCLNIFNRWDRVIVLLRTARPHNPQPDEQLSGGRQKRSKYAFSVTSLSICNSWWSPKCLNYPLYHEFFQYGGWGNTSKCPFWSTIIDMRARWHIEHQSKKYLS